MKLLRFVFTGLALTSLFTFCSATISSAQDDSEKEEAREYEQDESEKNLTKHDYSKQDVENWNFENSVLTLAIFTEARAKDANFKGADLTSASLNNADFTNADFRFAKFDGASGQGSNFGNANLSGTDLSNFSLQGARLLKADLSNVKGFLDITRANFTGANLRGANLEQAKDYTGNTAVFRDAEYDRKTRWPNGFDPVAAGAKLVKEADKTETKPADKNDSPKSEPKSKLSKAELEKAFSDLDVNGDDVLSGKEMRAYKSYDTDEDGEVSKEEFLAGAARQNKE
jgi:uncharacterized protein YjbI with pentapeptide repeats